MYSLPKGGVGAEIGVDQAVFSEHLLEWTDPQLLWLVDSWQQQGQRHDVLQLRTLRKTMHRMRLHIGSGQVRVLVGPSVRCATHVPNGTLDWLYIDADHTYHGCKANLDTWSSRVKKGGLIAIHDYTSPIKTLGGVRKAIDEFVRQKGVSLARVTQEANGTAWFWKEW
ncbi:hypothetical protein LCGC14_0624240 [marine sediment metagenome]|uniref:Methyltransferase type 11 domain-containing protein n=1 Tax=marine sediment metagenome TaxID=412755 RepID=A0A0F9UCD1_9ZZZZ